MPTQRRAAQAGAEPKVQLEGERTAISSAIRDFGGVNQQSPRDAIGDTEFYWLEEIAPIGAGNLVPVTGPGTPSVTIAGETGAPSFTYPFNVAGNNLAIAIWTATGNAWVGGTGPSATWTKIATGLFTSGRTAVAQWSNTGILIVDPVAGYFDWNITTPNVLTNLAGHLYGPVMNPPVSSANAVSTVPTYTVFDPTGTGGAIGASTSVTGANLAAAGSGYIIGDVLTAVGGTVTTSTAAPAAQRNQPLLVTITAIGVGGAVAGFAITSPGYYQVGPTNPISFAGGTGTGFTATAVWLIGNPFVITPGANYTNPTVQSGGPIFVPAGIQVFTSGTLLGDAIAVYAGRVWIAISRTVQFTDADSYSSFGNSGSAFTINDSYLHNRITALFAANNYLYIFGDSSIDILSNVQVGSDGIASFSRINVSASIGTTRPRSVFAFDRSIMFANNSGFYALSGATPQKLSDELDNVIAAGVFTNAVWGAQVMVFNVLCPAFLFTFNDSFVNSGAARTLLMIRLKNRWWFTSQMPASGVRIGALVQQPVAGLATLYGWSGNALYPLFSDVNVNDWQIVSKLWDYGAPLQDKLALKIGVGAEVNGAATPGITVTLDTERVGVPTTLAQVPPEPANQTGYHFYEATANGGGAKHIGMTITGDSNTIRVRMLALEAQNTRSW